LNADPRFFIAGEKEATMPLKGPTSDSGWKPTRTQAGAAVGGHQRPSQDISKALDRAAKSRTATSLSGKGRC
jgi:hypothetical protein